jgi:hypothetical protein
MYNIHTFAENWFLTTKSVVYWSAFFTRMGQIVGPSFSAKHT